MRMNFCNMEIRKAILQNKLTHYEVAARLGVTNVTFSRWMSKEMPEDKKNQILDIIYGIEK